jgi:hypothetical protein
MIASLREEAQLTRKGMRCGEISFWEENSRSDPKKIVQNAARHS